MLRGLRPRRASVLSRLACVGLAAAFVLAAAGCGGDDDSAGGTTAPANGSSSTVAPASLLGPNEKATGTPVKIGLITNGGDCTGCGNKDEEPTARATVAWLNEHMNGIAGHPIDLVVCVDSNDPGKSSDCANQMIRDDVAAVVLGTSGVIESPWKILHDAQIPAINTSTTNSALLSDKTSTYILNDPVANTVAYPIGVAKQLDTTKVSIIVVDVPAATDIYKTGTDDFADAGIDVQIVPVALGTPDMTPQAQQVVSKNRDGLVMIVGHDQFCIPAMQGLQAVGFTGSIATISFCLTDATRKAIPGDRLDGIQFSATAPLGDDDNPEMQQYFAVLDAYAEGEDIDRENTVGISIYQSFGALSLGTKNLQGDVTPASVNDALHSMDNEKLPGSGINFRCNGKAAPSEPAVCSAGVLSGTVDSSGNPSKYDLVNNEPIGD